jgi:tRNA A37 methylthiotransferase MiaB
MAAITNVRIVRSHLLEDFRSDELNNVLKKPTKFRSRTLRNCSYWVNIEIMERNLETKTRTYFFELVQELDKVEGIERLRISSMSLTEK